MYTWAEAAQDIVETVYSLVQRRLPANNLHASSHPALVREINPEPEA